MAEHVIGPIGEFPPGSHRVVKIRAVEIGVFNVEAVSKGATTYVYYEDGVAGTVDAMTFDGTNFSSPATLPFRIQSACKARVCSPTAS